MHDGVILFTSPNITNTLGYPRDMWLGRSFIDFVHPKDRPTFASQIMSGVAPCSDRNGESSKDVQNTMYVLLTRYRGLVSHGFGVRGKPVSYEPFQLVLSFREPPMEMRTSLKPNFKTKEMSMVLVITATPVRSYYTGNYFNSNGHGLHIFFSMKLYIRYLTEPEEILNQRLPRFSTKHTEKGVLTHVDGKSVAAFGYLPQDIIGRSIMDFYHAEDMPILKETYGMVMKNAQTTATPVYSPPYRFLIKNGCYVILETEWTSFVNPWSRKLVFIVGHHRVLKGSHILTLILFHDQLTMYLIGKKKKKLFSIIISFNIFVSQVQHALTFSTVTHLTHRKYPTSLSLKVESQKMSY